VIDWKSNHLGPHPTDYGPAPLADAMAREGYHLQHLLYSLALQRWLARRLPGFDAARHFGGVLYLFVRGVRPGWRNPDGTPCGVFFHQPGTAVMAALSALLAGQAPRP
jgi:exodeoxyribonuclease V beta subunit